MGYTRRFVFGALAAYGVAAVIAATPLLAADLTVPRLELATMGSMQDGDYILASHAAAELAVQGGYKFGAALHFAFDSINLEETLGISPGEPVADGDGTVNEEEYRELVDYVRSRNSLSFVLAKAMIREPFNLPLEVAYFIGRNDVFCSGDDFPARFGSPPIATDFRGFPYDPDGIGGNPSFRYDGIHTPIGTGLSFAFTGLGSVVPILYAYQDSATVNDDGSWARGRYSTDLRLLVNAERIKFETFVGVTTENSIGRYRAGTLAFFSSGSGADFLSQVGVTGWDPEESLSIDDWYFLFEPRIDFGAAAIIITLFSHPLRYLQRVTEEERGATDINTKILIGDALKNTFDGGLESTFRLRAEAIDDEENFSFSISPFLGFVTEGVRWDFKVAVHPLRYDRPEEMIETSVGVRTAF